MTGKKIIFVVKCLLIAVIFMVAYLEAKRSSSQPVEQETVRMSMPVNETPLTGPISTLITAGKIETGTTNPAQVLRFAKTLIGIPYRYASTDPDKGFDCSGFVTYVFNHFNIGVPRSSVDFTHIGKEIDHRDAAPGDLILFTGSDSTIRVVGHMGIVESNENDNLQFIHASSGKAKGVVITPFEGYYKSRFVKVIRIFPDHFFE